jgi:hypothetical protein
MGEATPASTTAERTRRHEAAMATAREAPAQHVPRHVPRHEARAEVLGRSAVGRLNTRIAVAVTGAVGTMWAAYLFVLISLVSFPQALDAFLHGNTIVGITWLSQSFLQLVLLPIIIVGQNVSAAAADARAEADHETLTALQAINVRQLRILENEQTILELLREKQA